MKRDGHFIAASAEVDRIMALSDAELLTELDAGGLDVNAEAKALRLQLERASAEGVALLARGVS